MLVRGFKSLSFLLSSRLRPLALHHRQRRPSLVSINSRRGLSSSSEMSRFLSNSSGSGEMDGKLPDCWGHRGASAAFPENTLASFEAAIRDGSDGIESDVHVSLDDVVIMFHDPSLDRTTNMTGLIREQNWYGPGGMENARTKKEPKQSIPTFAETVELLMKEENRHVVFNIDIKVHNDPTRLFSLMHTIISSHPSWQTSLAPRIILGLWHPKFIAPARKWLGCCTMSHIGLNPGLARRYFWESCEAFSMLFFTLCTWEGQRFIKDCKAAGKKVMVWTVNDPRYMMECVRWGVDAIITDHTKTWFDLRETLYKDYTTISSQHSRWFLWTNYWCWYPFQLLIRRWQWKFLETNGGPIEVVEEDKDTKPLATKGTEAPIVPPSGPMQIAVGASQGSKLHEE